MTDRMLAVLRYLATHDRADGYGSTGNQIGEGLGFRHGMEGDRTSHNGKRMGAANRVNFAVTRLEHLGLVSYAARRGGLSGTAYRITEAGREALASATREEEARNGRDQG